VALVALTTRITQGSEPYLLYSIFIDLAIAKLESALQISLNCSPSPAPLRAVPMACMFENLQVYRKGLVLTLTLRGLFCLVQSSHTSTVPIHALGHTLSIVSAP